MMRPTRAKEFQREADECLLNAEKATNVADKQAWQRLADDLRKLARLAELCGQRRQSNPIPARA